MNTVINIQQATIQLGRGVGGSLALASFQSSAPVVGEPWKEEGGVLAGVMPAHEDQPAYYLIVPNASEAGAELSWGPNDTVHGLSACDGKANTALLIKADDDHPAAEFCDSLEIDGFNDFYLPSRREASLMAATVPLLFETGYHWTSTQNSANYAIIQDFDDGIQGNDRKSVSRRVRAVRRLIIN